MIHYPVMASHLDDSCRGILSEVILTMPQEPHAVTNALHVTQPCQELKLKVKQPFHAKLPLSAECWVMHCLQALGKPEE